MDPLVSVVITTWNRREDLKETLLQLKNQKYSPLEIIVMDNNSTDGTGELIREYFPAVRLIVLSEILHLSVTSKKAIMGIDLKRGI